MVASFGSQGDKPAEDALVVRGDTVSRQVTLRAGNLLRGAVLGIIEAASDGDESADALLSASGASDGSQIPRCILAEDTDASSEEKQTVAYFGGTFNEQQLNFGVGHDIFSVRAVFDEKSNIKLETAKL